MLSLVSATILGIFSSGTLARKIAKFNRWLCKHDSISLLKNLLFPLQSPSRVDDKI